MELRKFIFFTRKRVLVGRLLLFLFITPFALTFVIIKLNTIHVKNEVKHKKVTGFKKEDLVLLKFSKEDTKTKLYWEHSKEFKFKGKLYDVVEKSKQGDTLYFWCWEDNKETKLNQQLQKFTAFALGNNHERKNNKEQLLDFYKSLFCVQNYVNWNRFTLKADKVFEQYSASYLIISIPPSVPPPRIS